MTDTPTKSKRAAREAREQQSRVSYGLSGLRRRRGPEGSYLFDNMFRVVLGLMMSWLPAFWILRSALGKTIGRYELSSGAMIIVPGFLVGALWVIAAKVRRERRSIPFMFWAGVSLGIVDAWLAAIL